MSNGPLQQIERLLRSNDAAQLKGRRVFRLGNGALFAETAANNDQNGLRSDLARLRQLLHPEPKLEQEQKTPMSPERPAVVISMPDPASLSSMPDKPIQDRVAAAIAQLQVRHDTAMAQAIVADRVIKMLQNVQTQTAITTEGGDDPLQLQQALWTAVELVLTSIAAPPAPAATPEPVPQPPPPPPQAIASRVQVTRDLVLACTQTFQGNFTIADVAERMIGQTEVDHTELVRIKQSISGALLTLVKMGQADQVAAGIGRRPSIFRAQDLTHLARSTAESLHVNGAV